MTKRMMLTMKGFVARSLRIPSVVYLQCLRASLCMWQIVVMFSIPLQAHMRCTVHHCFSRSQLHGLGMKFLIHNKE